VKIPCIIGNRIKLLRNKKPVSPKIPKDKKEFKISRFLYQDYEFRGYFINNEELIKGCI